MQKTNAQNIQMTPAKSESENPLRGAGGPIHHLHQMVIQLSNINTLPTLRDSFIRTKSISTPGMMWHHQKKTGM